MRLKSDKQAWLERENKCRNKMQLSETCSVTHTFQTFLWVACIICVTIHKKTLWAWNLTKRLGWKTETNTKTKPCCDNQKWITNLCCNQGFSYTGNSRIVSWINNAGQLQGVPLYRHCSINFANVDPPLTSDINQLTHCDESNFDICEKYSTHPKITHHQV